MHQAVWTRAGAAVIGATLLVGGLTACSGDKAGAGKADGGGQASAAAEKPSEAVKASYLKTVGAKFAKAEISTTEPDGKVVTQSGTKGWYPSSHDLVLKSAGKPDSRSVMISDLVWTQMEKPVGGKPWMKMDLSSGGKPGVRLNEDPAEYLAMLLDQDNLGHVGTEKTDGVEAEHYRGSYTLDELLKADQVSKVMPDDRRKALQAALEKAQVKTYGFDVWIGKDGYPVRVDTALTDEKGTAKTTAKFSGFGATPAVQAPPADQVADFDEVMKGLGG
ncbi:hypothetical protein [Streptomyces sp. NPDC090022]|uniref:hypothetical protein n=1 Tax=Streptomyces sp. NPDC090022 TaxID=3365920 RepID=UPI003829577F